ncbi:MAG: cbb3-type cytochrome c oxidase subunit I [Planctomycetes bacterium]|nr:cbb3-type cytochrome c oxidase subunit I [Planctomycetota bacterium]
MPPLVRRYIKTAFAFLVLGLLTGLHISAVQYLGFGVMRQGYIPAHAHMILVGFLLMVIMGVALWMFPKPAEGDPRWKPARFELVYWLIVVGVIGRSTGEIVREYSLAHGWNVLVFGASCLEVLAVIVFVVGMLPRIRSPREDYSKLTQ